MDKIASIAQRSAMTSEKKNRLHEFICENCVKDVFSGDELVGIDTLTWYYDKTFQGNSYHMTLPWRCRLVFCSQKCFENWILKVKR